MKAPENTLSAFKTAIELGADFIECDVHLTKDKVPVIVHDDTIENIPVRHLTLDEIHEKDVGSWFLRKFSFEKVPTLKQLLELDFGKTGFMIEVKNLEPLNDCEYIHDTIQKHNTNEHCYVGSKSLEILKHFQKLDPSLPLIGIAQSEQELEDLLNLNPKVLALRHQLLSPELIEEQHQNGIEVWCWTIDDPDFHVDGLDGVITNNVARFLQTKVL